MTTKQKFELWLKLSRSIAELLGVYIYFSVNAKGKIYIEAKNEKTLATEFKYKVSETPFYL